MNRSELIRHLLKHGCKEFREGSRHTIFIHVESRVTVAIPRHNLVDRTVVRRVCKDVGISLPPEIR